MNGNIRNRCMAHAALAARELPLSMRSQEFRKNVQAKCFRHDVRPTSAEKRCDASEETRISAIHVKHLHECLAGLEELPLGDGPFKCPGQWRFGSDNNHSS